MRFLLALFCAPAFAAPVDFVREVRPIFERHCHDCHGEKKQKSGLRLDVKVVALKGGDRHGPDIVPGNASQSPLMHFLTSNDQDEVMPPKGPITVTEIQTIARWINEGANWPEGIDKAQVEDKRDHWSFKPLKGASGSPTIDAFIDAKLAEKSLRRSPPADPLTWLRRVTFDLIGLPPTPEEVAAFYESCRSQGADQSCSIVVDRLLASPRYGERWAQHWLDVVRYADTYGFEVNTERPNAWPYRDYVIRAFNRDVPYDRFIREQIMGDQIGPEADAATGFLVTASVLLPGQIGKDAPSIRLARQDSLDEIVVNVGQTFLGLSVGCARCHDHKFDPISAKDYYAMQAMVSGVEYADRPLRTPEASERRKAGVVLRERAKEIERRLFEFTPLAMPGASEPRRIVVDANNPNTERFEPLRTKRVRFTILATNSLEPCLDELEIFNRSGMNVALATVGAKFTTSGDKVQTGRHEPRFINDGRYGNSSSWMSGQTGSGWVEIEFAREEEITHLVWSRDRQGKLEDRLATEYRIEADGRLLADSSDRVPFIAGAGKGPELFTSGLDAADEKEAKKLFAEMKALEPKLREAEVGDLVFAGRFREPDKIHLLNRGDPEQPKELVTPAVLSSIGHVSLPDRSTDAERRKALAEWIVSPQNPLTARVMVNRIWQGHFGTGLVSTPSDFGRMGMKPSHPELLDWLAAELIRSGWSVKHMHRLIVLSGSYRQSGFGLGQKDAAQKASALDADARLLWRFPSRRIEAEVLHDSILAVSGALNLEMHGRGFDLFDKRGGLSGFKPVELFTPKNQRRMVYAHKVRREPEAVFGAFDCPDAGQSTALRRTSTTPIQALNLFNSQFTMVHAEIFASRLKKEAGNEAENNIHRAYQLALNRNATAEELREVL
ncbi:MAG: PSD1 and planctomycete cytochrome C domain-containing protein, partial [Prosthecobacter sp.]